ncbi:hypothetical protein [Flavobacterium quisquiliarum]|uniref:Uncharacterized protein n=1 Tax=Flavobacterium quisquiliarum TaxID=1834436 RepID=A0ABV8W332_9FLAO|nr:hypothetical protein [Flavobacterium quisquiliarum]MBW1658382.1 hypothetical protein [Flavobacterium quisquiliarum]NWL02332.1 hypothetical protein [Flavobacterium collinsii]
MNLLKIFDQTFTHKKRFVFFILFELLSNAEFEETMPVEYEELLSKFNLKLDYGSFNEFDLNVVLNQENKALFIKIFESINSNRFNLVSNDANQVLKSKLFSNRDRKKMGRIICDELENKIYITDIFNAILNGLKFETFYEVSVVASDDLIGDWTSIKETGQLRINYNMTDWMPIGSKIKLKIEPFKDELYKFIGLATVMDYNTKETFLITVHETNVHIKNGFFYHYHFQTNNFLYKKPIYEFENDIFKTTIDNYDFVFKREY